jgi:uncharacterized repeat protein (TIGR02543 family)
VAIPVTSHITGGENDCTLADICGRTDCTQIFRAAGNHTPNADDGDCTTAVHCSVTACDAITTAAETSHITGGENDCTLADICGRTDCTQIFRAAGSHDWGEWTETTPATATATGEETRECTVCGATETRDIYAVTWEADGGSPAPTQTSVNDGGDITAPAVMTRTGYTFGGWFMDNTFTTSASFPITNVEKATTLYAKWTFSGGTLTIPSDNGGTVINAPGGTTIGGDGTVTFPDDEGGTITTPDGTEIDAQGGTTIDPDERENPFTDVKPSDWFYNDVGYAYKNGLFNGMSATTFSPNNSMSRAMLVTVLWRIAGSRAASGTAFTDVVGGLWYSEAVAWAAANGIVSGIGGGLFSPDAEITREQLAVMIYNYQQYSGKIPPDIAADRTFNDAGDISGWAAGAVDALVTQGIISGKPGGIFEPQGTATRAEVAAMLHRYIESITN